MSGVFCERNSYFLFVLFAFCFVPLCAAAQDFAGVFRSPFGSVRLLFRVSASGRGYEAVLDSPDQGVRGVDSVSVGGSEVVFGVAALQASYRGALLPGDMLVRGGVAAGVDGEVSVSEPGRDASRYADRGAEPPWSPAEPP